MGCYAPCISRDYNLEDLGVKDKQMMEILKDVTRKLCLKMEHEHDSIFFNQSDFNYILSALQQVRKEAILECAKLAKDYGDSLMILLKTSEKPGMPYHLRSQGTLKGSAIGAERIEQALRQLLEVEGEK